MMIDIDAATQRILAAYDAADDETRRLGAAWYPGARTMCGAMQPGGHDADTACGVVAALSPRCQWATNLAWAAQVLAAKRQRKGCPAVHTTAMRAHAWRIAGGENPLEVLNGPKVRAFYGNLTGNTDAVTVDVWAARLALGQYDVSGPGKHYDDIAEAYQRAAWARDVQPSTMQATTWIHIRGKAD
jgi:hypothetical protein